MGSPDTSINPAGNPQAQAALANLLIQADNWLQTPPSPLATLRVPGGYADPAGHEQAMRPLVQDSMAALGEALAWIITGDLKYLIQADMILAAWEATLKKVSGFDSQLALVTKGMAMLESWRILGSGARLQPFNFLSLYIPAAQALISYANNPGAWGWCGLVLAERFMGKNLAGRVDGFLKHLKNAVDLDSGDLWREDRRTNSGIWYTSWALQAYTKVLFIFKQELGQDYFSLLRPAYQRLAEFVLNPETWPHRLPGGILGKLWRLAFPCADVLEIPVPGRWPSGLLDTLILREEFYPEWLEPNITSWLEPVRPINEGDALRWSTLKFCYGLEP